MKLALIALLPLFLLGCDTHERTLIGTRDVLMTVTNMVPPKRFSVKFQDMDGKSYRFYKKRCSVYGKYTVGSEHVIKVATYRVTGTRDGIPYLEEVDEPVQVCDKPDK